MSHKISLDHEITNFASSSAYPSFPTRDERVFLALRSIAGAIEAMAVFAFIAVSAGVVALVHFW